MKTEDVDKIVNAVPPGWVVVLVTVPTRALRVIRDDLALTFRVEQLDATTWTWRAISTHVGDEAWESKMPAFKHAHEMQTRLKEKIKLAQHEARMAMIKAQNPMGASNV